MKNFSIFRKDIDSFIKCIYYLVAKDAAILKSFPAKGMIAFNGDS